MKAEGWSSQVFDISPEGLSAWQEAIAAHASQISTFWSSLGAMYQAVAEYLLVNSGIRLWRMAGS